MRIATVDSETGITLELCGETDLRDAAAVRDALRECLASRRPTLVALDGLETAGISLLQILCAAVRAFAAVGVELAVRDGESGVFRNSCNQAGLDEFAAEVTR